MTGDEEWRPIPGFENYEASDQGLVWAQLFRHRTLSTQSLARLLSPEADPTLPGRLADMERLGLIKAERVHEIVYWSAVTALDQLPVATAPPPPQREQLIQRFRATIATEIEDGIAEADPVAFVARWKSALREVGAR